MPGLPLMPQGTLLTAGPKVRPREAQAGTRRRTRGGEDQRPLLVDRYLPGRRPSLPSASTTSQAIATAKKVTSRLRRATASASHTASASSISSGQRLCELQPGAYPINTHAPVHVVPPARSVQVDAGPGAVLCSAVGDARRHAFPQPASLRASGFDSAGPGRVARDRFALPRAGLGQPPTASAAAPRGTGRWRDRPNRCPSRLGAQSRDGHRRRSPHPSTRRPLTRRR